MGSVRQCMLKAESVKKIAQAPGGAQSMTAVDSIMSIIHCSCDSGTAVFYFAATSTICQLTRSHNCFAALRGSSLSDAVAPFELDLSYAKLF